MSEKQALVTILRGDGADFALPEPASYSSTTSTMVDSDTNVNGKMLGSVIRESVAKISLSWHYLDKDTWAEINRQFNNGTGSRFTNRVRFFDQAAGDWRVCEMYVSDRSAGMWRRGRAGDVPDAVLGWLDCSLDLTEV